jgi:hypothetical protein
MSLTVEDRLDLLELVNDYARYFDAGDADAWAGLFVPDGCFVLEGGREVQGHDTLAEFVRTRTLESPGIRHLTTNVSVRAAGESATGSAYALVLRTRPGEAVRLRTAGTYEDEFVRAEGAWRFRLRRFIPWLSPEDTDREFSFEG